VLNGLFVLPDKAPEKTIAKTILIVEDDHTAATSFALQVERSGCTALIADTISDANVLLSQKRKQLAAIILDLGMPDCDGLDLLRHNSGLGDEVPVIVVTADGSINRAIEAMRLGAFDFLVKPFATSRLRTTLDSALQSKRNQTPVPVKQQSASTNGYMNFIGTSKPMQDLYRQIGKVAPSRAAVFITGESGTGKELCAEALHHASARSKHPFIAINCGAIPEKLLESQLFGHVKGSFTGAFADQVGAAQLAHRGTLFLDEICELELHLQVKLLRFLQTGSIQRVGCSKPQDVDVRIVCATNRDPVEEVKAGRLRQDLYYRLAVIPIEMPPLRVRGSDITQLADNFLQRFGEEEGRQFEPLDDNRCAELLTYDWPGNVRELQNIMRRAAVIEDGPKLRHSLILSKTSRVISSFPSHDFQFNTPTDIGQANARPEPRAPHLTLEEIERIAIDRAISVANGSLPVAARNLGISPSTLYRKRERWTTPKVQAA
jgi:two-component system, repressor protein LuxO